MPGKAIPYGIYDVAANTGWVNVGTDHDTAAFAVESIRRWWDGAGQRRLPGGPAAADHRRCAAAPTATAPARGKPGSQRSRGQTGLEITVCHFPPGHLQ